MPDWSKLAEWLKIDLRHIFLVAALTGLALVAPAPLIDFLGLTAFTTQYRPWIGGVFAIALGLFVVNGANRIYKHRRKQREAQRALESQQKRLHALSGAEKAFLAEFLKLGSKSLSRSSQNAIGEGLVLDELLLPPTKAPSGNVTYHMQFWVWEYLNAHPDLVMLSPKSE